MRLDVVSHIWIGESGGPSSGSWEILLIWLVSILAGFGLALLDVAGRTGSSPA